MIDVFTRECLALKVARSSPARAVTAALEALIAQRGPPRIIQVDNGSEFTSNHFDARTCMLDIQIDFIRPGKPVENGRMESFNGSVRDKLLHGNWFEDLDDARHRAQAWRRDSNDVRPHSSWGDETPSAKPWGRDRPHGRRTLEQDLRKVVTIRVARIESTLPATVSLRVRLASQRGSGARRRASVSTPPKMQATAGPLRGAERADRGARVEGKDQPRYRASRD